MYQLSDWVSDTDATELPVVQILLFLIIISNFSSLISTFESQLLFVSNTHQFCRLQSWNKERKQQPPFDILNVTVQRPWDKEKTRCCLPTKFPFIYRKNMANKRHLYVCTDRKWERNGKQVNDCAWWHVRSGITNHLALQWAMGKQLLMSSFICTPASVTFCVRGCVPSSQLLVVVVVVVSSITNWGKHV